LETKIGSETFYTFFVSNVIFVYFCRMNEELKNILIKVGCLYKKYGIKSITMDDVSRELGISKKTLYQYVQDKNELVAQVIELSMEHQIVFFNELYGKGLSAIDELFEVNKMVAQMVKHHNPSEDYDLKKYYPDLYQKIHKIRRDEIYNHILENLKKGKKEGVYRVEMNEEIIAKVQLMRIDSTFDNQVFSSEELLSPQAFLETFIYHIRGIASDKGIKILEHKLKELESNNN
jgi:TetR/AcrR family transcriptional regulator, cholesterol catabolism regulator